MNEPIFYKGIQIGEVRPEGKTLDKAAFLALKRVDRIRAYLTMVAPSARRSRTISRVTGIYDRHLSSKIAYSMFRLKIIEKRGLGLYATTTREEPPCP